MIFQVDPRKIDSTQIVRDLKVPGDKSISHRALMIGSLISGVSRFTNCLISEDIRATAKMLHQLGVTISNSRTDYQVTGSGLVGFQEPAGVLDLSNSGTTMRLGVGLLAPSQIYAVFTGDESLLKRPMDRIIEPISRFGAKVFGRAGNKLAPLTLLPSGGLAPTDYQGKIASAQVKSAFLLCAAQLKGKSSFYEPAPTRDHTELMLQAAGADVETEENRITIAGGKPLHPLNLRIPGDPSAAAFWVVAGLLAPNTTLVLRDVGINPRRTGFIRVLKRMGAQIDLVNKRQWGREAVADIQVRTSRLVACTVTGEEIPDLIDELPILAVAAAFAQGKSRFTGAQELRFKESDRIESIVSQFRVLGINITSLPDGFELVGTSHCRGGTIDSFLDHRIAMSGAVLALKAEEPVSIIGGEGVDTSYPSFFDNFRYLFGSASIQKITDYERRV